MEQQTKAPGCAIATDYFSPQTPCSGHFIPTAGEAQIWTQSAIEPTQLSPGLPQTSNPK